jgi:hypothetical protein
VLIPNLCLISSSRITPLAIHIVSVETTIIPIF